MAIFSLFNLKVSQSSHKKNNELSTVQIGRHIVELPQCNEIHQKSIQLFNEALVMYSSIFASRDVCAYFWYTAVLHSDGTCLHWL